MRGKVVLHCKLVLACGITPAYAGKSRSAFAKACACWDHPRVCGEKEPLWVNKFHDRGSPPRMRGKEPLHFLEISRYRITPAYAGKSTTVCLHCRKTGDHPRVCGEKCVIFNEYVHDEGSPPRMRGKVLPENLMEAQNRITPAYAGKSFVFGVKVGKVGDHPRVCGEKTQQPCGERRAGGSPPRMRGKEAAQEVQQELDGITPAYAGKSPGDGG